MSFIISTFFSKIEAHFDKGQMNLIEGCKLANEYQTLHLRAMDAQQVAIAAGGGARLARVPEGHHLTHEFYALAA